MSATAANVECILTSLQLILLVASGDEVTIQHWVISTERHIISEGIQSSFITELVAVSATYYVFSLQYQQEAAKTLEIVQRHFIAINAERGIKVSQGKVVSKKMGKLIYRKAATVNYE